MQLSATQAAALGAVANAGPRGISAARASARIHEEGSRLREHRPSKGASNWQTARGALGNLAAGRTLASLERAGLIERARPSSPRWVLAEALTTDRGLPVGYGAAWVRFDGPRPVLVVWAGNDEDPGMDRPAETALEVAR